MNVDGPTHPQEAGRCSREEPRVPPFCVEHADKLAHRLALLDRLVAEQAGGLLLLPDVVPHQISQGCPGSPAAAPRSCSRRNSCKSPCCVLRRRKEGRLVSSQSINQSINPSSVCNYLSLSLSLPPLRCHLFLFLSLTGAPVLSKPCVQLGKKGPQLFDGLLQCCIIRPVLARQVIDRFWPSPLFSVPPPSPRPCRHGTCGLVGSATGTPRLSRLRAAGSEE